MHDGNGVLCRLTVVHRTLRLQYLLSVLQSTTPWENRTIWSR